jgi:hypothetical protein
VCIWGRNIESIFFLIIFICFDLKKDGKRALRGGEDERERERERGLVVDCGRARSRHTILICKIR